VNGDVPKRLFFALKNVASSENIALAVHILPHLVLNHLLSGKAQLRHDIYTEFMSVLDNISAQEELNNSEKWQLSTQVLI
jgi:serine/threonine-protein kinase ATR